MRILVSNDDGIHANGIKVLVEALGKEHEVYVVAPDRERSASGHSLTMQTPLRVEDVEVMEGARQCWATTGTPGDCVKLAVSAILPKDKKPDLVISGINHGPNLGGDILYSGTVSCAMEGALMGIPSVAVSLASLEHDIENFRVPAEFMVKLLKKLESYKIPDKTVCIFDDLYKQIPTYKPTIKGIDNPYEEKAYKLIKQYVENDNRYKFTYKLPLAEFVTDKKFLKENPDLREFILRNSHLDFAIYTTSINKPIVAIEVDGGDHKKEKQKIRDAKKEKILEYMEIPLLRVPSKNTWTEQEFKEKIEEKIQQN